MQKIYNWAKENARLSQAIITLLHFAIIAIGFEIGIRLAVLGAEMGDWAYFLPAAAIAAVFLGYPARKKLKALPLSDRRKYLTIGGQIILASGLLLSVHTSNNIANAPNPYAQTIALQQRAPIHDYQIFKSQGKKTSKWKQAVRSWIIARKAAQAEKSGNTGKIIAIIALFTLLSGALTLALIALSCGLACNGYGALALLLALGGSAGIVALTALGLKWAFPDKTFWERLLYGLLVFLGGFLLLGLISIIAG